LKGGNKNMKKNLIKKIGIPLLVGAITVGSFFVGRNYEKNLNDELHRNDNVSLTFDYAKDDVLLEANIGGKDLVYREGFENIKDGGEKAWNLYWEDVSFDELGRLIRSDSLKNRAKKNLGNDLYRIKDISYDRIYGDVGCSGTSKENSLDKYKVIFSSKK